MASELSINKINGFTVPSGGFNAVLADYTVTSAAVTSIDFTGLDINAHGGSYEIELRLINATATPTDLALFTNGDTVNANYYYQLLTNSGGVVSAGQAAAPYVGYINASNSTQIYLNIALNNGKSHTTFTTNRGVGTTSPTNWNGSVTKLASVTNITQLTFTASVASSIGIGSRIIIRRKDF